MALVITRIAPVLLASVAGTFLVVSAHAETPTAPAADDCLAKPNGPSAKGSHWYYRVERPSGRHCWYQRPLDAAADTPKEATRDAPARAHTAAATTAPPAEPPAVPAAPPPSDTAAPAADNGGTVMPPVAAPIAPIAAPTAAPYGTFGSGVIPTAPPAAAPSAPVPPPVYNIAQAPAASAAQVPVAPAEPPVAAPQPPPDVAALTPKLAPSPTRGLSVAPHEEYADPPSHVPALFGAVSALVIIILGSYVGRLLGNRRVRRAQVAARTRDRRMPARPSPVSSSLAPIMAAADNVAVRETGAPRQSMTPDDWGVRRARKPRRAAATPAAPIREATRVLEDNVRELLGRLQNELRGGASKPQRAASAPPDAHAPTGHELDAVLAIWRARREAR